MRGVGEVSGPGPRADLPAHPLVRSVQPRAAAARELLHDALENLSQEELKRFRHKLRDALVDGRSIPWGRLERADTVDLADQLTQFYGPEPALDVARKTLKRADARNTATWLKEQRLQRERGAGVAECLPLHSLPSGRSPARSRLPFGFPERAWRAPRPRRLRPQVPGTEAGIPGCPWGWPRLPTAPLSAPPPSACGLTAGLPFRARTRLRGAALRVR